jgi:hypothetical protein
MAVPNVRTISNLPGQKKPFTLPAQTVPSFSLEDERGEARRKAWEEEAAIDAEESESYFGWLGDVVGTVTNTLGTGLNQGWNLAAGNYGEVMKAGQEWWDDPVVDAGQGALSLLGGAFTPLLALDKPRAAIASTIHEAIDALPFTSGEASWDDWHNQIQSHIGMGDVIQSHASWVGDIDLMPGSREWKPVDNVLGFVGDVFTDPANLLFGLGTITKAAKLGTRGVSSLMLEGAQATDNLVMKDVLTLTSASIKSSGTLTAGAQFLEAASKDLSKSAAYRAAATEVAEGYGLKVGLGIYVPGSGWAGRRLRLEGSKFGERRAGQLPEMLKGGFSNDEIATAVNIIRNNNRSKATSLIGNQGLEVVARRAYTTPLAIRFAEPFQLPGATAKFMTAAPRAYAKVDKWGVKVTGESLREGVSKYFNKRGFITAALRTAVANNDGVTAGAVLAADGEITLAQANVNALVAKAQNKVQALSKRAHVNRLDTRDLTLLAEHDPLTVADGVFPKHMKNMDQDELISIREDYLEIVRDWEEAIVDAYGGWESPIGRQIKEVKELEGDGYLFRKMTKEGKELFGKDFGDNDLAGALLKTDEISRQDVTAASLRSRTLKPGAVITDLNGRSLKLEDPRVVGKSLRKQINDHWKIKVFEDDFAKLYATYAGSVGEDLQFRYFMNGLRDKGIVLNIDDAIQFVNQSRKIIAQGAKDSNKASNKVKQAVRKLAADQQAADNAQKSYAAQLGKTAEATDKAANMAAQAGKIQVETQALRSELLDINRKLHELLPESTVERAFHRERVFPKIVPLIDQAMGVIARMEQLRVVTDALDRLGQGYVGLSARQQAATDLAEAVADSSLLQGLRGVENVKFEDFLAPIRAELRLLDDELIPELARLTKQVNLSDQTVVDFNYVKNKLERPFGSARVNTPGTRSATASKRMEAWGRKIDEIHEIEADIGVDHFSSGHVDLPALGKLIDDLSEWAASPAGRTLSDDSIIPEEDIVMRRLDEIIEGAGVAGETRVASTQKQIDLEELYSRRTELSEEIAQRGSRFFVAEEVAEARRLAGLAKEAQDKLAAELSAAADLMESTASAAGRRGGDAAEKVRRLQNEAKVLELEAQAKVINAAQVRREMEREIDIATRRVVGESVEALKAGGEAGRFVEISPGVRLDLDLMENFPLMSALSPEDFQMLFLDGTQQWGAWRIIGPEGTPFARDVGIVLDATRIYNSTRQAKAALRTFDQMTNWMKAWLVATTGFISRNGMGAVVQNATAGVDVSWHGRVIEMMMAANRAGDGDMLVGAKRLAQTGGKRGPVAKTVRMNPGTKTIPASDYENLVRLMELGVRDQGITSQSVSYGQRYWGKRGATRIGDVSLPGGKTVDNTRIGGAIPERIRDARVQRWQFPEILTPESVMGKNLPRSLVRKRISLNPLDAQFFYAKAIRQGNGLMEDMVRLAAGMDGLSKGLDDAAAINRIYDIHFNYAEKTDFHRGASRVVPFYTWMRYNVPFQMQQMAKNPGKFNKYFSIKRNMELGNEDTGEEVPDYWLKPFGIKLPFKFGGSSVYGIPDLPFMDALRYSPTQPIDSFYHFAGSVNPLIKAPVEAFTGTQFFHGMSVNDRYQTAPTGWDQAWFKPVIAAINVFGSAAGFERSLIRKAEDGTMMVRGDVVHVVNQYIPFMDRARRWFPNEAKYQGDKYWQTLISNLFGFNFRINTPEVQVILDEQEVWEQRQITTDQNDLGFGDRDNRELGADR